MSSIEEQYYQMDEDQLKKAYKSSAGLHKRIIEKVLLDKNIEFIEKSEADARAKAEALRESRENLQHLLNNVSIPMLMQKLKQDDLDIEGRTLIQTVLLSRADELEQYAYEILSTGNFSHKLVQPLELNYRLSLIEIEKLSNIVKEGREYEAIDLFSVELKNIIDIHDILLSHYNQLYHHVDFLKHFKADKMGKYNYSLPELVLEEKPNDTNISEDTIIEKRLLDLGYGSEHWYIKSSIINKCEYFFKVLTDLIEPDYEYKNYNIIHEFTDSMSPEEYESYCATILEDNGWEASLTKGTGDQGADVIGRKNGLVVIIQCKLYSSPVGNKAVQEVHSAVSHYHGQYGIVVTNNTFTQSAKELATSTNTILSHHNDLANILNDLANN